MKKAAINKLTRHKSTLTLVLCSLLGLTACSDDDQDSTTQKTLTQNITLAFGDEACVMGGTRMQSGLDRNGNGKLEASEITKTENSCKPNLFAQGVALPFNVLGCYPANSTTIDSTFDIRQGGFGSDVAAHPSNKKQFYALTDRGPNADFTDKLYGAGKVFAIPDYVPKIGLFEVQDNGTVKLIKTINLKDRDGKDITGLPNTSALGGTGETPYDVNGKVITVDPTKPYDVVNNPIRLDDYGLDSEGLTALNDGTFWVSDEYGPHIVHYDANGKEIGRINPFKADKRNNWTLPNEFSYRRANRGMEGLTISPDQKTLVGIMQSTMSLPNKNVNKSTLTRIVTINLETGKVAQYLYQQEIAENSNSAIIALSATQFLVLERDGLFYKDTPNVMKNVYRIDLSKATNLEDIQTQNDVKQDEKLGLTIAGKTLEEYQLDKGWDGLKAFNIVPAPKTLVLDMGKAVKYPHDKMEGLWLINSTTLGILNDDDMGLWNNAKGMEPKYLDAARTRIDINTLYIMDKLNLKGQ
ncbi:esterase-like activity of phytase family protein [Acinetobacter sp. I-MWF]|uniref:esterase-like activity of phytase family protein n=1 Tax=Acinetobacter sp. I-MWF TaxID=2940517 RepID=UPI0021CA0768|nr:esterase-like activity of phytase family protein [Acinetobacter sp. I-MWF]MCT9980572.1 esterase-like activity of phytase family protein [Acinetobacter sp. I-MWF]